MISTHYRPRDELEMASRKQKERGQKLTSWAGWRNMWYEDFTAKPHDMIDSSSTVPSFAFHSFSSRSPYQQIATCIPLFANVPKDDEPQFAASNGIQFRQIWYNAIYAPITKGHVIEFAIGTGRSAFGRTRYLPIGTVERIRDHGAWFDERTREYEDRAVAAN